MYYKVVRFSQLQDDDFINEVQEDHASDAALAKYGMTVGGSVILGGLGGALTKSGAGVLVGAGLGALGGYKLGKSAADSIRKKGEDYIGKYKSLDENDKEYLRNKYRSEKLRREEIDRQDRRDRNRNAAIIYAGTLAGRNNNSGSGSGYGGGYRY